MKEEVKTSTEYVKIPTGDEKKAMEAVLFPASAISAELELAKVIETVQPYPLPVTCSHLKSLYDCCLAYLQVKYHVHHAPVDLNVGEEFYLDVGIRNKSLPPSWNPPRPEITFKDVRLVVSGTGYAISVGGVFSSYIVSGSERLTAGETEYRRIRMKATDVIPEAGLVEYVGAIYVWATVDWERLFRIKKQASAYHQIVQT